MNAIFLVKGNAYMGLNKFDKDGNIVESKPAHFETSDDGPCVAIGEIDLDTMKINGIECVYGDYQASGYLQDILDRLEPKRQSDIPDFKEIIRGVSADGIDICDYCPSLYCRDCIITRWKSEED